LITREDEAWRDSCGRSWRRLKPHRGFNRRKDAPKEQGHEKEA